MTALAEDSEDNVAGKDRVESSYVGKRTMSRKTRKIKAGSDRHFGIPATTTAENNKRSRRVKQVSSDNSAETSSIESPKLSRPRKKIILIRSDSSSLYMQTSGRDVLDIGVAGQNNDFDIGWDD